MRRRDFITGAAAAGVLATAGISSAPAAQEATLFPRHAPMGKPRGINPGRVSWLHNPLAVHWDGVDFWWKPENYNQDAILAMIQAGIVNLASAPDPARAWQALFAWKNRENGKSGAYRQGEKVAIKTNMNGAGEYNDDPHGRLASPYGNPVLLKCLLLSLVRDGGVAPAEITVFDTCRIYPDYMRQMCASGELAGVRFRYRDMGGANDAVADKSKQIHWAGDVTGEATYFPSCLTEATWLINLANLKGHSWGLTLGAKNHFGSFVNSDRRRTPAQAGLHPNIIESGMGEYSVLADLAGQRQIDAKTVLTILDALVTATSETGNITPAKAKWEMEPFNGGYACSLFFSQDPVAIDSVGADFLVSEPVMRRHNSNMTHKASMENYLHEAAQRNHPPSGSAYTDGEGGAPKSLGAHEHWNNPREKLYSGNLKPGQGIELVYTKL
ncbi:MAG: DUF362 domain-containing protein [Desulfovibrio sp.]|nr:DUF362 domain-containing protein [Desulfovibrio sp.]